MQFEILCLLTALLAITFVKARPIGDDIGTTSVSGIHAQAYGNKSPQSDLTQGSFNRPCLAIPVNANLASLEGVISASVLQDVPVLSNLQTQQCLENSLQVQGDESLSELIDSMPVLSGNGEHNQ